MTKFNLFVTFFLFTPPEANKPIRLGSEKKIKKPTTNRETLYNAWPTCRIVYHVRYFGSTVRGILNAALLYSTP